MPDPSLPDTSMPAAPAIINAASVILFRQNTAEHGQNRPEILMMQRAGHLRFAAHAAVFPGGRVDPADRLLARQLGLTAPASPPDAAGEQAIAQIAAIRETLEETG